MIVLIARYTNYVVNPEYSDRTHSYPTHLRVDALFFGVMIAYFYHFHSEPFNRMLRPRRYWLVGVGLLIIAIPGALEFSEYQHRVLGLTHEYLGSAAVMVGIILCQIPKNKITNPLASVGGYSYSIYLWHMAAIYWVTPRLRESTSWELRAAIYLGSAFVLGIGMAKLWELPALKLRDRFFPSMIADHTARVQRQAA